MGIFGLVDKYVYKLIDIKIRVANLKLQTLVKPVRTKYLQEGQLVATLPQPKGSMLPSTWEELPMQEADLITVTGTTKRLFKLLLRSDYASDSPRKTVFWPIWLVMIVAIVGAFIELREFPMNGNPFAWARANSNYKDGLQLASQHNRLLAMSKYLEAIRIYDKDSRFYRELAREKVHCNAVNDALELLNQAISVAPHDVDLYLDKADALRMQQNRSEAGEDSR